MNRQPIHEVVRDMIGRDLDPNQLAALETAIDTSEGSLRLGGGKSKPGPAGGAAPALGMAAARPVAGGFKLGAAGTKLIQRFEGCAKKRSDGDFEAYPDPGSGGKPWTIGWGTTGKDIKQNVVFTQKQCDDRFQKDMQRYVDDVARAIGGAPTTQHQFDAMVSFHYNTGAIARATLTKLHNAGDHARAAKEFLKWNKAGGKVLRGLTLRRQAEADLYKT